MDIIYSGGSACDGAAQTLIHVVCGSGDPGITEMKWSADGCSLVLKIVASAGCGAEVEYEPGSDEASGTSAGTVLLILVFVGAALYVCIGCVVNWKLRGATTAKEMFPNYEFWAALPSLVKDGALFVVHGFKKGDYVSV